MSECGSCNFLRSLFCAFLLALFKYFLAVSVVIFLYVCVVSAFQTSIAFAVIWFLQGLVQGGSWPACAKIMKQVNSPLTI